MFIFVFALLLEWKTEMLINKIEGYKNNHKNECILGGGYSLLMNIFFYKYSNEKTYSFL